MAPLNKRYANKPQKTKDRVLGCHDPPHLLKGKPPRKVALTEILTEEQTQTVTIDYTHS